MNFDRAKIELGNNDDSIILSTAYSLALWDNLVPMVTGYTSVNLNFFQHVLLDEAVGEVILSQQITPPLWWGQRV